MSKFHQEDLPYGEAGEKFVLSIINRKHSMAYKMEGYFVEYDIMIPEIDKTVEVKRDKHTDRTGNAFDRYDHHQKNQTNFLFFSFVHTLCYYYLVYL